MQPEDVCYFWTYNKTEETCKYSSILKAENGITGDDVLTGSRFCSGKCNYLYYLHSILLFTLIQLFVYKIINLSFAVFYPHCAETDVNYSGAPVIETYNTTTTIEECVGKKHALKK